MDGIKMKLDKEQLEQLTDGKTVREITSKFIEENIGVTNYTEMKDESVYVRSLDLTPGICTAAQFKKEIDEQLKNIDSVEIRFFYDGMDVILYKTEQRKELFPETAQRLQTQLKEYIKQKKKDEKEFAEFLRLKEKYE
jgi:hypothetical protein